MALSNISEYDQEMPALQNTYNRPTKGTEQRQTHANQKGMSSCCVKFLSSQEILQAYFEIEMCFSVVSQNKSSIICVRIG